jgi:hypothetical protein
MTHRASSGRFAADAEMSNAAMSKAYLPAELPNRPKALDIPAFQH